MYLQNFGAASAETEGVEVNADGSAKDTHGNISNGFNQKTAFRVDDIINGDAGNYFGTLDLDDMPTPDYSKNTDPDVQNEDGTLDYSKTYVRPWFNIDGDSYIGVRKEDRMERILNSAKNLQFTRFREKESDYTNTKTEGLAVL
ncbi:MAG: hypothetical protein LUC37_06825 [Prevotella sp.]|nr:hypothetical protein [Prevotella sp.]